MGKVVFSNGCYSDVLECNGIFCKYFVFVLLDLFEEELEVECGVGYDIFIVDVSVVVDDVMV